MTKVVEIQGDTKLLAKLDDIANAAASNRYLMGQIGNYVELQILERTAKGIDADSQDFPPYNPSYKKRRDKAGRPVNKVDLFFTGSMLSALTYEEEKNLVTLFFMNTEDRFGTKNPEKAYYNQQLRNFFAMSADDIVSVEKMVKNHINRHIKK